MARASQRPSLITVLKMKQRLVSFVTLRLNSELLRQFPPAKDWRPHAPAGASNDLTEESNSKEGTENRDVQDIPRSARPSPTPSHQWPSEPGEAPPSAAATAAAHGRSPTNSGSLTAWAAAPRDPEEAPNKSDSLLLAPNPPQVPNDADVAWTKEPTTPGFGEPEEPLQPLGQVTLAPSTNNAGGDGDPPRLGLHSPAHRRPRQNRSILKPNTSSSRVTKNQTSASTRRPRRNNKVTVDPRPIIRHIEAVSSDEENETPSPPSDERSIEGDRQHGDLDMMDTPSDKAHRPSLKLKLSSKPAGIPQAVPQSAQTPAPPSATRTPSIKLNFGRTTPHPASDGNASSQTPKKDADTVTITPASASTATKKRKRPSQAAEGGEGDDGPPAKSIARPLKPPAIRKITLKQTPQAQASTPAPLSTKILSFKTKGKAPKRPLGVGYDSELEYELDGEKGQKMVGREIDPVVHEGVVLRMPPGEDCEYVRKAIEDGTAGMPIVRGGADIHLRMLDTLGRRGILKIRKNQYATTLVDLPCIIEGMKSWDKKGWIKSIDLGQMLLVLGPCITDEQARNYPLPEDVDPKTYQYAHGLTAPMKWVRKRRFARTKRARVDDIEAVERRVHALLEADKAALSSRHYLLDHDPRLDEQRYSSGLDDDDDDEDEDAEGEDDDEPADYFAVKPGTYSGGGLVETPMLTETPVDPDIGQDEVDEFTRMFDDDDDDVMGEPNGAPTATATSQANNTLHLPGDAGGGGGDSSFAITSTSASPSVTQVHTPDEESSDEDDDAAEEEEDEDLDDAEKEGDENLQQVKDRIDDMQTKIAEQTELLKKTQNAILKKKLARKIQDLKDDVAMMRKNAGLGGDEDDD